MQQIRKRTKFNSFGTILCRCKQVELENYHTNLPQSEEQDITQESTTERLLSDCPLELFRASFSDIIV